MAIINNSLINIWKLFKGKISLILFVTAVCYVYFSKSCDNDSYTSLYIKGIIGKRENRLIGTYRKRLFMHIITNDTTIIISDYSRRTHSFDWQVGDSVIKEKGSLIFSFKSRKDGEWHKESWECRNSLGY